jgi:hypothetical protein
MFSRDEHVFHAHAVIRARPLSAIKAAEVILRYRSKTSHTGENDEATIHIPAPDRLPLRAGRTDTWCITRGRVMSLGMKVWIG